MSHCLFFQRLVEHIYLCLFLGTPFCFIDLRVYSFTSTTLSELLYWLAFPWLIKVEYLFIYLWNICNTLWIICSHYLPILAELFVFFLLICRYLLYIIDFKLWYLSIFSQYTIWLLTLFMVYFIIQKFKHYYVVKSVRFYILGSRVYYFD